MLGCGAKGFGENHVSKEMLLGEWFFSSCYAVKFFRTPKVEFYGFLLNMFISEPLKIETNLYRYNFVHEQKDKIPKLFGSYPSSSKIKAWEFSTIPIRNVSNYI